MYGLVLVPVPSWDISVSAFRLITTVNHVEDVSVVAIEVVRRQGPTSNPADKSRHILQSQPNIILNYKYSLPTDSFSK